MASFSKAATFNLKVIVQETGIKPDTLRAWERRYGLPAPDRTSGGHRLYSEYDIEMVKWFMARQDEGLSISRAVKLWQKLAKEGKNPLEEMEYEEEETPPPSSLPPTIVGVSVADMRQAWIESCQQFDETSAERILTQAFAIYPVDMVCLEILQKGVAEIGRLWYENKMTVQQEHFASALAMRRLNTLLAAAPAPTRAGRILIGCPSHENHTFAPLLLTLLLRYQGWDVIYLGADVPLARLESTIAKVEPDLIVLTAQQLHTAATLFEAFQLLTPLGIPLAYGGRVFDGRDNLQDHMPGHFLGRTLPEAVQSCQKIIKQQPDADASTAVSNTYKIALDAFRSNQAELESRVWSLLAGSQVRYKHTTIANSHLSRDIVAALTLGDLSLLESEIAWIDMLMTNYEMPEAMLQQYLAAYYQAADELLNDRGRPIVDWLATALKKEPIVTV